MYKKVIIILADGFEEIEAVTVIDILRRGDIDVSIAGLGAKIIRGSHGIGITVDKIFGEIKDDFDGCILPGGMPGAVNLSNSKEVNEFIKKMNSKGKLIAAICAAPAIVLGASGVLDNKTATCYPGMQDKFSRSTTYKNTAVVIDGNIITSQGPATAFEFAFKIMEQLAGSNVMQEVRTHTLAD